jgi:hypothetical protein
MTLTETRQIWRTDISLSVSGVAERGGIIAYDPVNANLGIYANAAAVSGQIVQPAGLLLDDVEALNYFLHPEYRQRNVVPQGSVVGLATECEVWTDFVETTGPGGISVGTYAPGDALYMADNGNLSRNNGTFQNGATAKRVRVGTALSALNSDGFLKVRIEL